MNISMLTDNEGLIKELDELGAKLVGKTEVACDKMADVIRPALIRAAPYDGKNHKFKHLKEVIAKTKPRKKTDSTSVVIWVKPRGIPKAKQGAKASKNWNADKHIYKLVVSEYGRSDTPAKPFWTPTVTATAQKALQTGAEFLKKELEK